jgi:hypothetical protein
MQLQNYKDIASLGICTVSLIACILHHYQKADELFITNVITGIQPITKYRKKEFTSEVAKEITNILNAAIN